jgi:hypothetical protein
MRYLLLAAALSVGITGSCLAQGAGTNDNGGKTATERNANPGGPKIGNSDRTGGTGQLSSEGGIAGPTATSAGDVRPCNMKKSETSDHENGNAKASTASLDDAGGSVSGC